MSFQWLEMRIVEEQDRRKREEAIMERLPLALEETHEALAACVEDYQLAFGSESSDILLLPHKIKVTVRVERDGKWQQMARVEILADASIPGFQIDKGVGGEPFIVEVGILPGDKLFYRDRAKDQYITIEELTRRTLDRALFPNLVE